MQKYIEYFWPSIFTLLSVIKGERKRQQHVARLSRPQDNFNYIISIIITATHSYPSSAGSGPAHLHIQYESSEIKHAQSSIHELFTGFTLSVIRAVMDTTSSSPIYISLKQTCQINMFH